MTWFRGLTPTAQGIVMMIIAVATFSAMDAIAKGLAQRYQPMQVLWARYTCHTVVVFLWFAPRLAALLRTRHLGVQMLRSAFVFGATFCFFTSIAHIGLAQATAVFDTNPLLVTLLAFLVLKERAGPRRIFGIMAGLVGALIIIRPGTEIFSLYAVLPLLGACFYASYVISTRLLGRDENSLTSLLYTTLIGTLVATILVPGVWQTPTLPDAALMLAMGVIGGTGQYFLIRAFTLSEAAVVAPFTYVGLIFAVVFGYLFFDEIPDAMTFLGALVIVGSGLYVWHRERQQQSEQPA